MKQIKIVYITKNLVINGISTMLMNYCKNIDKKIFSITIIAGSRIDEVYIKECNKHNINLIELPSKNQNPLKYYKNLWKELSKNKYDIVHIHGNSANIVMELIIAKLNGIKIRIAHSHNTTSNHKIIHKILRPIFNKMYTHAFACSSLAGRWMFGNKEFYILPNGFSIEKFKFDRKIRNSIRKELNIPESAFLLGHVGRFNVQKNHPFLLKAFENIASKNSNAYLLLVGDGPDYQQIEMLVNKNKYKDRIILFGESSEVENLYSAMDIFVFPSIFEGLGIVLLEAQINGLPCITSDVIPIEAAIIKDFEKLSLNESIDKWSKTILKYDKNKINRIEIYSTYYEEFKKYDILQNVKDLEFIYKNISK